MNTVSIDTNIYKSAESFARRSNVSIREFIEKAILAAIPCALANVETTATKKDLWREYKVSPEVMAMTFSERKDFEDAVQYASARTSDIDVIVTRNPRHFKDFNVKVQTPSEFLDNYYTH